MPEEFEARLIALAERTMRIKAHCAGEDATRIYLVMPFIELLGYDAGDPSVIVPEHDEAIDFAIMIGQRPAVAIECTGAVRAPSEVRKRARAYCETHPTSKLAIATNGVVFEVFVDSQKPGILDAEPFLTLDLAEVAANGVDKGILGHLFLMRSVGFDAEAIAEQVYADSLRDKLKALMLGEFRNPSEAFCRLMLEQVGIAAPESDVIATHYRPIMRSALEQAIIVPVLQVLKQLPSPTAAKPARDGATEPERQATQAQPVGKTIMAQQATARPRASIGERLGEELAIFGRAKRRSA